MAVAMTLPLCLAIAPADALVSRYGRLTIRAQFDQALRVEGNAVILPPFPNEGALRYVTVKHRGKVIARRRFGDATSGLVFDQRVPTGRYRIVTYVRGCVGTCRTLSKPFRKCVLNVRVRKGRPTRVSVVTTRYEPSCLSQP